MTTKPNTPRKPQKVFLEFLKKEASKENRKSIITMLLKNLRTTSGQHDVQKVAFGVIKYKRYSNDPAGENDQQAWYELPLANEFTSWAECVGEEELVAYFRQLLPMCRLDEVEAVQTALNNPKADRNSAPVPWWNAWDASSIVAVDCEMVSQVVGTKSNGKVRCKQVLADVAVVSFEEEVIFKQVVKQNLEDLHFTTIGVEVSGYNEYSYLEESNGMELQLVQEKLDEIFKGKLLIFVGASNDFSALKMPRGKYNVFDLHEYYQKDNGKKIGLRSLVMHYYGIDIQIGSHSSETDAMYTMKIFKEHYIPEKLENPSEVHKRGGNGNFNHINTIK